MRKLPHLTSPTAKINPKQIGYTLGFMALLFKSGLSLATTVYDLNTDFSYTSNPNGVWSYTQGGSPIPNAVLGGSNGWRYGVGYGVDGSIEKWGSSLPSPHDMQANDVIIETVSLAYGGDISPIGVTWTSPDNGEVSLSGRAWDALFYSGRNANWTLSVGGVLVAENTSGVYGLYRNDPAAQFDGNLLPGISLNAINVTAGEQITFLTQTTSYYGHFMGVDMTVSFTPVPIPAAVWLFGSALAGLIGFSRRKRS